MRADGITVRLKAVNNNPIEEHPDTKSLASLISFASRHPFLVSITIHDDFDWKDANHLLVSVAFDGLSSDPTAYVRNVLRRVEKAAFVLEQEYIFDRWLENTGGQIQWVAFLMPISCLFPGRVDNPEIERARVRVSLTRGSDNQHPAASTASANTIRAKDYDALTFTFTNTALVPKKPSAWTLPPPANTSGSSIDVRPKAFGLPISKSKAEVVDLCGEDEEEGPPVKSEATSLEQRERTVMSPTETTTSEVTHSPPAVLQPDVLKERKRAKLMLELERVELQKKELAIREQLLDFDN